MHDILADLNRQICKMLEDVLPTINQNWWEKCVINQLSFNQQKIVRENNSSILSDLDLAALLRIFDQNWYEIKNIRQLPLDARNWLKECQTIRNRWAHLPSDGLKSADLYRDLDTVSRLLKAISSDEVLIAKVEKKRDDSWELNVSAVF
ncbi:MAG: hypothetical protein HQL69_21255 [Magnetococcales bacterium]|nr:hypothetical protein [Magnetococcales bacterium]